MKPFVIENLEIRIVEDPDWDTMADFNDRNHDKLSENGFAGLPIVLLPFVY